MTLIFSDTHLSHRVHRKKLAYLKSIIEPADRVIIVGDFWDGFLTTFDKFVKSGWNELFPLLLQKQTIYLYGNHDRPEWCDQRVSLFSTQQTTSLNCTIYGQPYHIIHGDTILPSYEHQYPIINRRPFLRLGSTIERIHKLALGNRFLAKPKRSNNAMRQWVSQQATPVTLICGHSHYPEIDPHHAIINPGFIGMGYGNHVVIEPDTIKLIKERY